MIVITMQASVYLQNLQYIIVIFSIAPLDVPHLSVLTLLDVHSWLLLRVILIFSHTKSSYETERLCALECLSLLFC